MIVDDWYDDIDEDPEVSETVDDMFKRLKSYDVIKLEHYRKMAKEYRAWHPLPLEEYAVRLQMSQKQIVERELRKARTAQNNRVARQNKLPPTK